MLYLQASFLSKHAKTLLNAKRKGSTLEKTLLASDRFVSMAIVMIPLFLLAFTRFFTPSSSFGMDSMICAHPFEINHSQNSSYWLDYGFGKDRVLTFGGHRGYVHNYCWKHAKLE